MVFLQLSEDYLLQNIAQADLAEHSKNRVRFYACFEEDRVSDI